MAEIALTGTATGFGKNAQPEPPAGKQRGGNGDGRK
jgi:hypothetical protein